MNWSVVFHNVIQCCVKTSLHKVIIAENCTITLRAKLKFRGSFSPSTYQCFDKFQAIN